MKSKVCFVVCVSIVVVVIIAVEPVSASSENIDLFMEQLTQGPDAVTVSLSALSSEELLELSERAAPVLLKEGRSGRVMGGILEALSTSWGMSPPIDTISALMADRGKDPMFRWSLIECFSSRRDNFSDTAINALIGDLIGIVADNADDGIVRRKAAITISLLDRSAEDVRSALVSGLNDTDLRVVEGCAYGLRNIDNKGNVQCLLEVLTELRVELESKEEGSELDKQFFNTLCQVALALGEEDEPECVEALGDLLVTTTEDRIKGSVAYGLSRTSQEFG